MSQKNKPKLIIPDWESHDIKAIVKANPDIKIIEIPFMIKQFKISKNERK